MMLKSTRIPILSSFPAKLGFRNLASGVTACRIEETPQTVRRNAVSRIFSTPLQPPASVYVHLPFCRKRCFYCDFPVVALGSTSSQTNEDDPRILNYIELVCREINGTKLAFGSNQPLETVFFGGGTPSLVPPKLVSSILDVLRVRFGLSGHAEISMEMDPGTFDAKRMEEFVELGVNRVSVGVQAFQDELLRACGRAHGVKEVHEAIDIVKSCGVENWSMDLISSLPHQTPEMWLESLRLAVQAQPNHLSIYDLQVEQGTKFGVLYTPGEFPLPSDVQSADFYKMASKMLTDSGYNHYEISSYCKDGFECKHNYTYWENKPFYAFGLGSASYVGGIRLSRPRKMREYMDYVQKLENGVLDFHGKADMDANELAMDVLMLSLRTAKGLDVKSFGEVFGGLLVRSLCEAYKPSVESGHVVCLDEKRRVISADEFNSLRLNKDRIERELAYLRLSDPHGFLISNELISVAFGAIAP